MQYWQPIRPPASERLQTLYLILENTLSNHPPDQGKKKLIEPTSYITPLVHKSSTGFEVICASQAHGVVALDFTSGKENWTLPDTMKQRTIVSPINVLAGSNSKEPLIDTFSCALLLFLFLP